MRGSKERCATAKQHRRRKKILQEIRSIEQQFDLKPAYVKLADCQIRLRPATPLFDQKTTDGSLDRGLHTHWRPPLQYRLGMGNVNLQRPYQPVCHSSFT